MPEISEWNNFTSLMADRRRVGKQENAVIRPDVVRFVSNLVICSRAPPWQISRDWNHNRK